MRVEGGAVKLGIEAPREIAVHRQEVFEQIQLIKQSSKTDQGKPNLTGP